MATVEYRHIAKSFGPVQVIRDISLAIDDGEFVVLLGPSGCGKTTLLRMTAGLERISGGELLINGRIVNRVHPRDRDIAMVFQNYALYPTMSVFDNIAFALEVRRLAKDEIRKKVEEAASVLNLTDYLHRFPRELSGGQRQRVAMGRAMVRDAAVFLFDEPLSNLDAKLRAHMRVEIRQLHNRLEATTIYVTHDQIEAMTMADKIVLMKGGDVEQIGSPDEVYDRPASRYAADFIGSPSMNFVDGEIGSEQGAPIFAGPGIRLPLPAATGARQGQRLTLGVRPADLAIADNGPIKGEVILTEKTGADVQIHTRIGDGDFIAIAPRDQVYAPGQSVAFDVAAGKMHLFDPESGRRVD